MIYKMKRLFLVLLVLCAGPMIVEVRAETGDELSQARQRVFDFETPLVRQLIAIDHSAEQKSELIGSKAFRGAIVAFFSDLDSTAMRLAAIELLDDRYVYIVSQELATDLLGPLIRDANPVVQSRAAKAIGYNGCGAKYASELVSMLNGDLSIESIVDVTYAMGRSKHQPFAKHLVELVSHSDASVRRAALSELTQLAPAQSFEHNIELLNDGQASIRVSAIQNLVRIPEKEGITRVEQMLDDEDASVRERAAWALGKMHSPESAKLVAKRLHDSSPKVRGRAALTLGELHATAHSYAVAALLKDRDIVVRRYATQALGVMGDSNDIEHLRPMLVDTDDQIRKYAAASIRQLTLTMQVIEPDTNAGSSPAIEASKRSGG